MEKDADLPEVKRESVCGYCGHGKSLHVGSGRPSRADGWCLACDERRQQVADASFIPTCWWFTE